MKPDSIKIAGTFDQLNPVRSERGVTPRSAAPVARSNGLRLAPDRRHGAVTGIETDERCNKRHDVTSCLWHNAIARVSGRAGRVDRSKAHEARGLRPRALPRSG